MLRPADDSEELQKWIRNDYMVTGWILNSIDKIIAESFIFTPSARDLWLEIKERYGHSNAPQLYNFHKTLMSTCQNDDSIVEYYNKLKKVWDQLQVLEPIPDCSCGALLKCSCGFLKKIIEADQLKKLIQFVAERQNSIVNAQPVEMSALLTVKNYVNAVASRFPQNPRREVKDFRKPKPDREFLKFMQSASNPSHGPSDSTTSFAGTVSVFNASCSSSLPSDKHVWIVDTGASDHMTISLEIFSSTQQLLQPLNIALPDGSIKQVFTTGTVAIGIKHEGLYKFLSDKIPQPYFASLACSVLDNSSSGSFIKSDKSLSILHARLGHMPISKFKHLSGFTNTLLPAIDCEALSGKTIRSDNGTEIVQDFCTSLFSSLGIVHQRSVAGNPQQNGRVERKHRHLLDTSRSIRIHANLPIKFWGDCILILHI
ncbi:uncharacterized protein LOC141680803 [Apium graveolens]|uniref:uncharacterized protein LOC141680803 n=1 Tax=Apium graveolens TaxID=4045 RepID=UPI003D7B1181